MEDVKWYKCYGCDRTVPVGPGESDCCPFCGRQMMLTSR